MKPITARAAWTQLVVLIVIGVPALAIWIICIRLALLSLKVAQWACPELADQLVGNVVNGFTRRQRGGA